MMAAVDVARLPCLKQWIMHSIRSPACRSAALPTCAQGCLLATVVRVLSKAKLGYAAVCGPWAELLFN